ncbi:hypothetical protein [Haloglomus litoreum]|uniref:hypothetical protein n=1 Tax=Haloglomus litoreum TaxID=3034026 RepID=UPI0023E8EA5D|nr:hypothetical protein [Haloglomus sp. DT116]
MAELHIYEEGERVGTIDLETSDASYDGDDGAIAMLVEEVDDGMGEVVPVETEAGLDASGWREYRGEDLRDQVQGVIENLGAEVEYVK